MNLGNLDFNLLKVLDALFSERNVTRAGVRLGWWCGAEDRSSIPLGPSAS